MLNISNSLLMSSVIVHSAGLLWLKPIVMVLFIAVFVEQLLFQPCEMLFVVYGSSVFSSVSAITERSEMGLYEVPQFMSFLDFGTMSANFHVCGMMLFSDILYMLVRYASSSVPMCLGA